MGVHIMLVDWSTDVYCIFSNVFFCEGVVFLNAMKFSLGNQQRDSALRLFEAWMYFLFIAAKARLVSNPGTSMWTLVMATESS